MKDSLSIFDIFNELLQTKEHLEEATITLVEELRSYNVIYAEIKCCPYLHTKRGLTSNEVCTILIKALKSTGLPGGIIVCGLRQDEPDKVMEMLDVALKCGAIGFDIAGNEQDFKLTRHEKVLEKARAQGMNITLHAGENTRGGEYWSFYSIVDAIDLGATRLGHITSIKKDPNYPKTLKRIINKKICIEACPIANVGSKITFKEHPINDMKNFIGEGLAVCLSSDNLLLAGSTGPSNPQTNLERLWELGFTLDNLEKMALCSIDHAFSRDIDKKSLKKQIRDGYSKAKLWMEQLRSKTTNMERKDAITIHD